MTDPALCNVDISLYVVDKWKFNALQHSKKNLDLHCQIINIFKKVVLLLLFYLFTCANVNDVRSWHWNHRWKMNIEHDCFFRLLFSIANLWSHPSNSQRNGFSPVKENNKAWGMGLEECACKWCLIMSLESLV